MKIRKINENVKFEVQTVKNFRKHTKEVSLRNLSTSIEEGATVIRISDNNEREVLGEVTEELLTAATINAAEAALRSYSGQKIPEAEECIKLSAALHREDRHAALDRYGSQLSDDLFALAHKTTGIYNAPSKTVEIGTPKWMLAQLAYRTAIATTHYSGDKEVFNYSAEIVGASNEENKLNLATEEYVRQGNFIVDYLTKNKDYDEDLNDPLEKINDSMSKLSGAVDKAKSLGIDITKITDAINMVSGELSKAKAIGLDLKPEDLGLSKD